MSRILQSLIIFAREHQLATAALSSLLIHSLLLGVFSIALAWFSVPSNSNRALVLTLDSSVLDGIARNDAAPSQTADALEVSSKASQSTDSDQAQLTIEASTQQLEKDSTESPPKPQKTAIDSLSSLRSSEREQSTQADTLAADELLVSPLGFILVTAQRRSIESELLDTISLSAAQQEMLEEKLKEWQASLEQSDDSEHSKYWEYEGQVYTASFTQQQAQNPMALDELTVKIVTQQNGQNLSTEMRLKKLAFSSFGQFVHRWDPQLHIHDDQMSGKFHSNSAINLEFDKKVRPIFRGKVTTASRRINMNRSIARARTDNVFLGGLETGVKKIRMPKPELPFEDHSAPSLRDVTYFDEDSKIEFLADGRYTWQALTTETPVQEGRIGDAPHYLVAQRGKTLHLSGIINGKVLVYSPSRIVIDGNLTYADFRDGRAQDDYLGIVSAKDVMIARDRIVGPGDLHIHASIYAKRRFVVRGSRISRTGTLSIYGSLTAGAINETEPRYATNIVYDPRLENQRPPSFPTTQRYELQNSLNRWSEMKPPAIRNGSDAQIGDG